jgi:hypothetical protein
MKQERKERKSNSENRHAALERGRVFSFEQIEDVLDLIAAEQWPNGDYGDDECNLWSLIRRKLDIDYW